MGESSEATSIQPDSQVTVVSAKRIDSHVELLIPE